MKKLLTIAVAAFAAGATLPALAASIYWTGAEDTVWDNTANWEGGVVPGNDEVYFQNDKFNSKFTDENGSIITFTKSSTVWRTRLRGAGSEQAPLIFRATDPKFGLDFGSNIGIIVADSNGSGFLRIESGTYPVSVGIRIGENATYRGELTVTGGAVLTAKNGNMDIQNGKVVIENGTIEISKTDKSVSLGNKATGCELHLENAGVLKTSLIWDGNNSKSSKVLFNGGTLKANGVYSSSWPAIIADKSCIAVNVGADGGTIDTSGFNIQVARPIAPEGANDGGMTFKGGGSIAFKYDNTYTGATTVEVGTTLVVPSAIAGDKLAFTIPAGLADGVYEVVRISGGGAFAADVLSSAALPQDANARFFTNAAKTAIYCLYGEVTGDGKVWTGMAGDGRLSSAENWLDSTPPAAGDILNFSAAKSALSINADLSAAPSTLLFGSEVVTIAQGTLDVATLTNANKLAVASGATLNVAGDLVANYDGARFLDSNEGTVTVNGKTVFTAPTENSDIREFVSVTANTKPIRTNGVDYKRDGHNLFAKLCSGSGDGWWVVGAGGITFSDANDNNRCRFYIDGTQRATLYSSADWTLHNSGKNSTTNGDLQNNGTGTLTINTSDYDDPTQAHTVTLDGRINANGNVTISGCGKVIVNTTGSHSSLSEDYANTCINSGATLYVTDTATLQVNAGKQIRGAGTISLAAGTTLALPASSARTLTQTIQPSISLPAEGTATLMIDGERLKGGEYTIFATAPQGWADHLALAGTAVPSSARLIEKDGALVLVQPPAGLVVVFR